MPAAIRRNPNRAAIAMWDFSWLLRHYETGEFEHWDAVLDQLVARGYNAIRIEIFPALVAANGQGEIIPEHRFEKTDWSPTLWGNHYTTTVNPREALKAFIPRCLDRGLLISYSSWFLGDAADKVDGPAEFVRVWDETLRFLQENDLLHNVYYVDLLNEYPLFHGFSWLTHRLDAALHEKHRALGVHEWKPDANYSDPASRALYVSFARDAIAALQLKWPDLDFLFSLTYHAQTDWQVMTAVPMAALDVHHWFIHHDLLGKDSGYWDYLHPLAKNDLHFAAAQRGLLANWSQHQPALTAWMDEKLSLLAAHGRRLHCPVGNTEGWGVINWLDHPALTWEVTKKTAELGVALGCKHSFRFNCTSNFTHPHFARLWNDVAWHQKLTAQIRYE